MHSSHWPTLAAIVALLISAETAWSQNVPLVQIGGVEIRPLEPTSASSSSISASTVTTTTSTSSPSTVSSSVVSSSVTATIPGFSTTSESSSTSSASSLEISPTTAGHSSTILATERSSFSEPTTSNSSSTASITSSPSISPRSSADSSTESPFSSTILASLAGSNFSEFSTHSTGEISTTLSPTGSAVSSSLPSTSGSTSSLSVATNATESAVSPNVTELGPIASETSTTATISGGSNQSTTSAAGTVPTSDFDCSNVEPDYYGNPKEPCDTKFYICVDRSVFAYEQRCPAKLYYDAEMKRCDMWANIPACSGRSRPPVVSNETEVTLSPIPPVIDCYNETDGNYADPESVPKYCSNRFFTCAGYREFRFRCPRGLFYDLDRNQCDLHERVFACSGNRPGNDTDGQQLLTSPPVNFDCRGKADGYYVEKCDSVYYSCNGGFAREFRCPSGLVFDSQWLSCESPADTFVCTRTQRPSTALPPSTVSHPTEVTTASPLDCSNRKDDIYRDPETKCSRIFYYCAHKVTYRNVCPGNLYFDNEFKRCDLWINIFDCSGRRPTTTLRPVSTTPKLVPAVDYDCSKLGDGNYVNPKNSCSHFFYICANMEAFQQFCPAGLYYDPDLNNCDSWSNIFACSGRSRTPTVATLSIAEGTTDKPEFDCTTKVDGIYVNAVNACSHVYFRCSGSIAFKFNCPAGLYYDTSVDQCDIFDYVPACSGRSRPPTTPPTSSTSSASTQKPPIDCRSLADGDYADPSAKNSCSHFFYTCSSGFPIRRDCADGTYYDSELRICDRFWKVPACTGSPRPSTTTGPSTTRGSTGAPPAFDCTRQFDGNYAGGDCVGTYWSCVGGTTFPRQCPVGFVYDSEFDDCEYPNLVPKCGGRRITVGSTSETMSTTPVGGFSCNFLADGNYVDPAAVNGCSKFYYTCANGMTTRVNCPFDLYYDAIGDKCNSHDMVPACSGQSNGTISTNASSFSTTSSSSSSQSTSISETTARLTTVSATEPTFAVSTTSISSNRNATEIVSASNTEDRLINATNPSLEGVSANASTISSETTSTSLVNEKTSNGPISSSTETPSIAFNGSTEVPSTSPSASSESISSTSSSSTESTPATSSGTEIPSGIGNGTETSLTNSSSIGTSALISEIVINATESAARSTSELVNATEIIAQTSEISINITESTIKEATMAALANVSTKPAAFSETTVSLIPESINATLSSTSTVQASVAVLEISTTTSTAVSETNSTSPQNFNMSDAALTHLINFR